MTAQSPTMLKNKTRLTSDKIFVFLAAALQGIHVLYWLNQEVYVGPQVYLVFGYSVIASLIVFKMKTFNQKGMNFFIITIAVFSLITSIINYYYIIKLNLPIGLFAGHKVIALFIGIFALSPAWVGYFLLSLCLLTAPLFVLLCAPEILSDARGTELWICIMFSIIAFAIFRYRLETQKIQADLVEIKANEKALKDFSDVSTALRDLMSTPLQSLDLLTDLLQNEKISPGEAAEQLKIATYKLHELVHIFNEHQSKMPGNEAHRTGDSLALLRTKFPQYRKIES